MNPFLEASDSDLVKFLRDGEPKALEAIYRRYASPLYAFAHKRLGNKAECENIIQDIFESLWLRRDQLEITSLRQYLFNSVRYMAIRHFYVNRMKEKYAEHFRIFSEVYETLDGDERTPDNIRDAILKNLQGLPLRCGEAMALRVLENLPYAQIAARMNISRKTVEVYISKALAHLRERLKKGVDL